MKKKSPRGIPDFSRQASRPKDADVSDTSRPAKSKATSAPPPPPPKPQQATSSKSGQRGQ
jgi:hypothetical protein